MKLKTHLKAGPEISPQPVPPPGEAIGISPQPEPPRIIRQLTPRVG